MNIPSRIRLLLVLALFALGAWPLVALMYGVGPSVVAWLVRHQVVGVWGKAVVLTAVGACSFLLVEAAFRLPYLGTSRPGGHHSASVSVFLFCLLVLFAAWMIASHYFARLLGPLFGAGVANWLELVSLAFGALAMGIVGDRFGPRFGLNLPKTRRSR